ncbi:MULTISPECIES: acyltransferase domain-containing protein [Mesorhizobium]|uniref:acyltransferase domain-containing protein n=1 Tax=Mesorhizobium TaxID=68287 RepID=UPI0003CF1771|nr:MULTISPECIES: acyltransferase domain-containing protein [Mesorhizobium]ESY68920.1 ACP S-malonyltransferase [Mesorhizobium sp. LNHC232B00]WJI40616.1 acyltransferase domain-containing protein [Mesorhizobium opportunistum]
MSLAILCSGQGRQHADMFALTGHASQTEGLFKHAATLLGGHDPRQIVRTGASDFLHQNLIGQILCSLQALAAGAVLRDALPDRVIVAGYSVGEVAAWGVAGVFSITETLDLVACRAKAMDTASRVGDGLLFVRGLPRDQINRLCELRGVAVAIVNPGDSFVLGGSRTALGALAGDAKAMGATRLVEIPVQVASHTKRLSQATVAFRQSLRQAPMVNSLSRGVRLLSGIDGTPVENTAEGFEKLAMQISRTVQWGDCLQGCIEGGATAYLELGPGSALSRMVASTYPDVSARSLDEFKTISGVCSWLEHHAGD